MNKIDEPQVTVVISTRNRGERIVKTVLSILKNDYPHFELRIIDQSEDDLTEKSLQPFMVDPRLHYQRSSDRGLSRGRNIGIQNTQSEFIALTDDDCEAPTYWLEELAAAFALDHRIGIIFGNVEAGPHDSKAGFIPTYVCPGPFLASHMRRKHLTNGISACMGMRRSVWQKLGGFDEMLGAGSLFKAGEETDFAIRALLLGYSIYETPEVRVIHHGFRTWEQGKLLIEGYLYGTGALFAKHFKCRHWSVIPLLFHMSWRWAFQPPAINIGHRPFKWLRLKAFIKGFWDGLINPVDRRRGHFLSSRFLGTRAR